MVEQLKKQIVVMELPLTNGERMFFFSPQPVYDWADLTEKGNSGNFYYYNSGTCPMNWLQDVVKVAHVDANNQIDGDPHGVFRLVGVFQEGDFVPELATNTNNGVETEFVNCIVDAEVATTDILKWDQTISTLLDLSATDADVEAAWRSVMGSKVALYMLSRRLYEGNVGLVIKISDGYYSLHRGTKTVLKVIPQSAEEFARVKFLVEFDVLYACNF